MPDLLPNSLPRNRKVDWSLSNGSQRWMYLYCASCGCDGGRVLETEMPDNFAFYLCDEKQNNCVAKWSDLAGVMLIPDEVFFEKVKQAQLEAYGHILTQQELAIELQDDSSIISKLKKETV